VKRFCAFKHHHRWQFDAVTAEGAHYLPVALLLSRILDLPLIDRPDPNLRVLLCSAVLKGPVEAVRVSREWRRSGVSIMHFCIGLEPTGDPDEKEPEIVGCVHRCAVPWYRVEPYSRLEPESQDQGDEESPWPGFSIGPAFVDPNSKRVADELYEVFQDAETGAITELLLGWYDRHQDTRAFLWT
jgi:hypothetical protein